MSDAIAALPPSTRKKVKLVDDRARSAEAVSSFLEPIRAQAHKWPEDAFLNFSEAFLYDLVLAQQYGATISGATVQAARGFLDILDFDLFGGEGRHRLAELVQLILCYEPHYVATGAGQREYASVSPPTNLLEILRTREFHDVLERHGALGLAKRPALALGHVGRSIARLVKTPEARRVLRLAAVGAEIAPLPAAVTSTLREIPELGLKKSGFAPHFEPIGALQYALGKRALLMAHPRARFLDGKAYAVRTLNGIEWLERGEERKMRSPSRRDVDAQRKQAQAIRPLIERRLLGGD